MVGSRRGRQTTGREAPERCRRAHSRRPDSGRSAAPVPLPPPVARPTRRPMRAASECAGRCRRARATIFRLAVQHALQPTRRPTNLEHSSPALAASRLNLGVGLQQPSRRQPFFNDVIVCEPSDDAADWVRRPRGARIEAPVAACAGPTVENSRRRSPSPLYRRGRSAGPCARGRVRQAARGRLTPCRGCTPTLVAADKAAIHLL